MSADVVDLAQRAGLHVKDGSVWGCTDALVGLLRLAGVAVPVAAPARPPLNRAQMQDIVRRALGRQELTGDDALLIRAVEAHHEIGGA